MVENRTPCDGDDGRHCGFLNNNMAFGYSWHHLFLQWQALHLVWFSRDKTVPVGSSWIIHTHTGFGFPVNVISCSYKAQQLLL